MQVGPNHYNMHHLQPMLPGLKVNAGHENVSGTGMLTFTTSMCRTQMSHMNSKKNELQLTLHAT